MSSRPVRITEAEQLYPGQMLGIIVEGKDILLANIEGVFYAIDNKCSHEDALLYNGALKQDCVECPLHGSRFSFITGQPMEQPATEPVKTYAISEEKDGFYITL
ncbi:MAG: non-heme iron oxygenase ferredoxin subunit [Halobacteria archaeon]|nr:non-heme iron oxygenase ferredoxin subunit [Halobacteria archaeon]